MSDELIDVLVVGAGPGGLAAAVTLGWYGIGTLVAERRLSPSGLPRANTLSTGTMELLRRWGLEPRVRERAPALEVQPLSVSTLAAAGDGAAVDAGFPTRAQARLVSPTAPASLGQDELEPILEARARTLPSVRIERGWELVGLDGPVATFTDRDGRRRRVRARYVVGADGVRSRVRRLLGIAVDGPETLEERLTIQFRAPLWELVGVHRYAIYFLTADPPGRIVLPAGHPDRWVYARPWDSAVAAARTVTAAKARQWVRDAAGAPALPVEDVSIGVTSYGIGLAERFREGDAFLIGDAAHRVTPRGATGLNTAIRDGFDLGWKLAWALRGWADLLDSYERERRPVAEFNTGRSMRPDGSLLDTAAGLNADIGGRIPHVWVDRSVSTLDVLGPGLTLFAGPAGTGPAGTGAPPVRVVRLDALAARGLGLGASGWLLARPDGHPVALSNAAGGRDAIPWCASSTPPPASPTTRARDGEPAVA